MSTGRSGGPGQTELDAGGHGLVGGLALVFEVLGKLAMQTAEHAQKVRGRELLDWQEAYIVIADDLEAPVRGQRMQVDEQPQAGSEPLHDDEHARMQPLDSVQAMLTLGLMTKRLHHTLGEALTHYRCEERDACPEPMGDGPAWPGEVADAPFSEGSDARVRWVTRELMRVVAERRRAWETRPLPKWRASA